MVTAFSTEPAYIMSIKEYATLDSLKGAEIRTPGGPKILEALGAVGVGMPQSEVAQALQTGVIKGVMSSREVLKDFKYAEKCKFILEQAPGSDHLPGRDDEGQVRRAAGQRQEGHRRPSRPDGQIRRRAP